MNWTTARKWLIGEFSVKRLIRSAIQCALVIYLILFLVGACCPYSLIFQPPPASYNHLPGQFFVPTGDSHRIAGVYVPAPGARYTLLYCHGNSEDIGQLTPLIALYNACGLSVVAYDYRGYGQSTGRPDEANSYSDADAVYAYAVETLHIPSDHLIIYGRSLGCAMALRVASTKPVAGLVLQSPFYTAYRTVIPIPILPLDRFKNKDMIGAVTCPVFILHGDSDHVIRPWHGHKLYAMVRAPRMCWWVPGAGHNDLLEVAGEAYVAKLREFVAMVTANQPPPPTPRPRR